MGYVKYICIIFSTTLGNLSNSPSACFVASDGESLRVFQAVIDARTLLAEIATSERRHKDVVVNITTHAAHYDGCFDILK